MPSISTQNRPRSTAPSNTTATQTQTASAPDTSCFPPTVTLRLRAEPVENRRIRWAEDVVDNEGLGRKKSKVCCIYHAPRAVGESSSEDDSSSDSDSSDSGGDGGGDNSKARMGGQGKGNAHKYGDREDGCCSHEEGHEGKRRKGKRAKARNAYENMPKRAGWRTVTEQPKN